MRKIFTPAYITLLLFLLVSSYDLKGITYSFSGSSGSAAPFITTNILIAPSRMDDFDTLIHFSGFNFYVDGINYNGAVLSANGWIALVPSNVTSLPSYFFSGLPVNNLSAYTGGYPLFAPLWDDDSCDILQYGITSNVLTVKWVIKWDKTYTGNYSSLIWMTLDGNTGIVTFNYSNTSYTPPPSVSASIGITGICNGTFYSVTPDNIPANSTVSTTAEDSLVNWKPVNAKYVFTPSSSVLIWVGVADTLYDNGINWNNCSGPDCSVNAHIGITANGNMPTVRSDQSVKDLIIDSGATLRILSPYTLSICGNLVNNGTFICEPGSDVSFTGQGTQTISGNFTGNNSFASLNISKSSGELILNDDIDVTQNFSMPNFPDTFNINGKYMKVGGDFLAKNITGITSSTLEFNGIFSQTFTANNSHLNNVIINMITGKIYLSGIYGNMIIDSTLFMNSGNIVTSPSQEVSILRATPSAIQNYSENSFIDGRLRRAVYSASMDFPVGDSLVLNMSHNGYELANINFTTNTNIHDLLAWFNPWGVMPGVGPAGPDSCSGNLVEYDNHAFYDNGYWAFENDDVNFNGEYDVTLYNTGGTNSSGIYYFTIATAPRTFNPNVSSSWNLYADCDPSATLQVDKRNNFNPSPYNQASSFNHFYATALGAWAGQVSVNELNDAPELIPYPNPVISGDGINIYSGYSGEFNFELYDAEGNLIGRKIINLNYGNNEISVDIFNKGLSRGIYEVRITSNDLIRNCKLIVD
jgi:hypothetical protein